MQMTSKIKREEIQPKSITAAFPQLSPQANKYTRGKLTIIGGNREYPGAACLSSLAAYRMGAGYVQVFCDKRTTGIVQGRTPSVVARDWLSLASQESQDMAVLASRLHAPQAVVIGSGMSGADAFERDLVCAVVRGADCPVVADGGALGVLGSSEGMAACKERAGQASPLVLTPHFGEAKRLSENNELSAPQENDPDSLACYAAKLAQAYRACVVLKGPQTYVALADSETVFAMTHGCAALAKAGTGDVLAGMIGALLCQGVEVLDAACIATSLHAEAARLSAEALCATSVMAEDVIDHLPFAIKQLA